MTSENDIRPTGFRADSAFRYGSSLMDNPDSASDMSTTRPPSEQAEASAWTPEVQDWGHGWRGSQQSWTIVDRLDHPALGLRYDQLSSAFAPLGLRDDWDETIAAQVALGVQAYISRELGEMTGDRAAWSSKMRTLTAVILTERRPLTVPFRPFAEQYHGFRDSAAWGWGSGPAGFRRLHERGVAQPFTDVDAQLGSAQWQPSSKHDYAALDAAWSVAVTAGSDHTSTGLTFLPLLPVEVCACFAAVRRRVVLDEAGMIADVPSLWELLAVALYLGPSHFIALAQRWVSLEAGRDVGARANRRTTSKRSAGTIMAAVGQLNGIISRFEKVAGSLDALASWKDAGRVEVPAGTLRANPSKTEDRTAVPLEVYRRAREQLNADVERLRPHRFDSDAPKPKRRYTSMLRRLIQVDLLGQLSARPTEVLWLRAKDVVAPRHFPNGGYAPAVWHTPAKGGGRPIDPGWRAIAGPTYDLLCEWISWLELGPDDRLFGDTTSSMLGRDFRNAAVIPLPDDPRHGYSPSRIRHMGEMLALQVGHEWIQRNPGWAERVAAQVFADAELAHRMKVDALGYKDLEANRELWAARTAMGDPSIGVAGLIDRLMNDAGARKAWDIDEMRAVIRRRDAAALKRAEAERTVATSAKERRRLRAGLSTDPTELKSLSQRELIEFHLRQERLRDEAARVGDRCEEGRLALERANAQYKQAEGELLAIQAAGRTVPLPDSAPFASELPEGDIAPESETWEQALTRAELIHRSASQQAHPTPSAGGRLRNELNIPEFAAGCGVTDRTVRLWLDGKGSPFPVDEPDGPVIYVTRRLRVIDFDELPRSFLDRLLPEQLELMEQILMVPMGSTRWGGRSIERARIVAAKAARLVARPQ